MSIYTSLKITRRKATAIIDDYFNSSNDAQLKELANFILEKGNRFNVYKIVDNDEPNDDDKLDA